MKKTKILIIGAGELGSRHVQSIYKDSLRNQERDIYIVDKNPASLELTQSRLQTLSPLKNVLVFFFKELEKLPSETFDLVILSTTANSRLSLIKRITNELKFKNLIYRI